MAGKRTALDAPDGCKVRMDRVLNGSMAQVFLRFGDFGIDPFKDVRQQANLQILVAKPTAEEPPGASSSVTMISPSRPVSKLAGSVTKPTEGVEKVERLQCIIVLWFRRNEAQKGCCAVPDVVEWI
jgi:hypothetical protein